MLLFRKALIVSNINLVLELKIEAHEAVANIGKLEFLFHTEHSSGGGRYPGKNGAEIIIHILGGYCRITHSFGLDFKNNFL